MIRGMVNVKCITRSGQLYKICSYIDDKKNGEYKDYYETGQLYKICSYTYDKMNGSINIIMRMEN